MFSMAFSARAAGAPRKFRAGAVPARAAGKTAKLLWYKQLQEGVFFRGTGKVPETGTSEILPLPER
jgi:hypothetical protein